ncbi:SAVED domain-containing protein [Bacillus sp. S17B2]|uniref:SAVED domain-containing protein n=1 Tax=Bacillus sp. S17B2 TaxID=2918907 RepID=UPI00227FE742|nr:SAVED domain-containing protein [Bacillus sp. S17B2]
MDKHLNGLQRFIIMVWGSAGNKMAAGMVAGGMGIIGTSVGTDWVQMGLIFLAEIFKVNVDVAEGGSTFVGVGAGGALVAGGVWLYLHLNKTKGYQKTKQVTRIEHVSIEVADFSRIPDEKNAATVVYKIDQVDSMRHLSEMGINNALFIQKKEVNSILNRYQYDDVRPEVMDYYGLAHIPFTILLGYQIADKVKIGFHEWNQNKGDWVEIKNKMEPYQKLILDKNQIQNQRDVSEIILKVGMTTSVEDDHLSGLGLDGLDTYNLHLENPGRNHIVSLQQLQEYKVKVRDTLDEINRTYPNLKKIHLFYSGQMSFAYCLGSTFSPRMDPQILVYNHVFGGSPRYNWVLPLKKAHENIEAKLTREVVVDDV